MMRFPQTTMLLRLKALLFGWGSVGVVYQLSAQFQGQGTVLPPSMVDEWIPFSPSAIWLYLSFFIIIPLSYLSCPITRLAGLRRATQLTALIAGAVYLIFPTTMVYPQVVGDDLSARLLQLLQRIDSPQNCLPSLHIALTVLAVWAMSDSQQKVKTGLYLLWGAAIAFSILQLRRHLFIDLVTGAMLAGIVGWIFLRSREAVKAISPPVPLPNNKRHQE
ncbi:inositol phosphorylceramide synthase [Pectobacterium parmentieri]|uniref:Inositol phosphorylceramide synthase n=2 Tax=Pectobacterium parmentieri TaxID=1905730 RepID=A0A8B3FGG6_PECPM|nr:phosphatase PAP2 family protein [Pectobacterium parmentieri]AOR61027.1 acid phosphatase [Pectobacterium parmentieri]AYH03496.1 inositol phosphorylceramide synthase [Pectobacterium parmentieri]AYH07830.1 inositol phosphorylceramide synthase [Pectobacterium parmentieri]AYH12304.1 inositol phosphorylceramide synthase [Pectobacterium parmentieri]AYH16582.1 inositol phosphorylceramide synthase [Pectobacterium parmentieri]